MSHFVKFTAINNKILIEDNHTYVIKIFNFIMDSGLISNLPVPLSTKIFDPYEEVTEFDEESNIIQIAYNFNDSLSSHNWCIEFKFGTFACSKQLQIEISSDTYHIAVENQYLEKLKLTIKNCIIRDWEKIIWLFDKDSELLSITLYPYVYKTENLLRQLINELMNKEYGAEWWDIFIPLSIKDKHRSRTKGYKSIVPGFQNIDEHLMSIDIGDLCKIITLKTQKWIPEFDETLNKMLTGYLPIKNHDSITEILNKQLITEHDLWVEQFSKYLSSDFQKNFNTFELNRNHIAHNKLIDRQAYQTILSSIQTVEKDVSTALEKLRSSLRSKEDNEAFERHQKELSLYYAKIEHERMESDADISIRNDNEIIELFDFAISNFMSDLQNNLRFREDIIIFNPNPITDKLCGDLFKISSKVTEKELTFEYDLYLIDEPGKESLLTIACNDEGEPFLQTIRYTNGEAYYNDDGGYYMPETEDCLSDSDIEQLLGKTTEYINEHLENLKDAVNSEMYKIYKDGGALPIAKGIECCECMSESICVDESYAPFGTCLNCGAMNKISECEQCGVFYEEDSDDEIRLCPDCLRHYDED